MKRVIAITILFGFLGGATSTWAKNKTIYKQGNNPANYVRLEKLKSEDSKNQPINQPYQFSEEKIGDILRSLRYSRKALFSDKIKTRFVFEEEYVKKYVPYLVKAFQEASSNQAVMMSVAQRRPYFIIRNDRLTQVRMWVVGEELHMKFIKTEAKLHGDYKSQVTGRKLIENAKGLRIALDPQQGQKFALDSNQELVVNINENWGAIVARLDEEEARLEAEKNARKERKQEAKAQHVREKSASNVNTNPVDQRNAEKRLSELKKLYDKGLITTEDYEKKKSQILREL